MLKRSRAVLASMFLPLFALGTLVLVFILYLPSQAASATYTVNSTADTNDGTCNPADCTLREAILAANDTPEADTIIFSLPPSSTITLSGTQLPPITGTLTIDGSTAVNLTISGNNNSRIFVIDSVPPGYLGPGEKYESYKVGTNTTVTITHLNIVDGREIAGGYGGAIFNNGTLLVNNSHIANSTSKYGSIYNNQTITITDSTISNSLSLEYGGAIFTKNFGKVTVNNTSFISNSAGINGGAIYILNGSLTVNGSTFFNNHADIGSGGAIRSETYLTITNSTFNNNSADYGGAVDSRSLSKISNSTFSTNTATFAGGAVYNHFNNTMTITNSTFSGNAAGDVGAGIYNRGELHYSNTIFANSVQGEDCSNLGTIETNVNNLVEDGNCNPAINGDPLLGPLKDNGGNTKTQALLAGSPAIDNGHPATCAAPPVNNLDQRGESRPIDGDGDGTPICDIGAYEAGLPDFSLVKNGPAVAAAGEFITYTLTVSNNLPVTVTGVVLTDTIPVNASYISGGTLVGNVVSWTLPELSAGAAFSRSFVVTATQTITNDDYRVSAGGGYSTTGTSAVVTIVLDPISGLSAGNDGPTIVGSPTNLTAIIATGSDVSFAWDFGDGSSGSGANVSHTYPDVGQYTAVVTASNLLGEVTDSTVVTVLDVPISGLSASNDGPTAVGSPTTLMASVTAGTNVNYDWAFGDGTFGSGAVVMHTYPDVGQYTAVVTASNTSGEAIATTQVTIENDEWTIYMPAVLNAGPNNQQAAAAAQFTEQNTATKPLIYIVVGFALIPTISHFKKISAKIRPIRVIHDPILFDP